ncbi:MAG: hypothetical protein QHH12_05540 [Candidatus Bathyarchaeota archaeon]|nr:hypothetical protein [Candidatus Bathyarchaeota archaeon]
MPFKDECNLCGRVFPYSYLRRCFRCGKLFCVDCMVPDAVTGDTQRLLCLNCARKTVSPTHKGKYEGLTSYLRFRAAFTNSVRLSLAQIDGIVRDNLPMSAYRSEKWWENSPESAHAKAWLDAGWETSEVNLKEGYVVFQKVKSLQKPSLKKKRESLPPQKPFTPPPSRILRRRKPSKTKMAKLSARLKNIERVRIAQPKLRGKFKPKPAHEKRVFKPKRE